MKSHNTMEIEMGNVDFNALVAKHRQFFLAGATRSIDWRDAQLTALHAMMTDRADEFYDALWTDLRRNRIDADLTDVKFVADDAAYARAHLRQWMHPQIVSTPVVRQNSIQLLLLGP